MRIGLGVACAYYGSRAIRRYAVSLAREMARLDPDSQFHLLAWRHHAPTLLPPEGGNVRHRSTGLPGRLLVPLWSLGLGPPVEAFTGPLDLYHATDFDLPVTRRAKRAFTVHGLAYHQRPDLLAAGEVARARQDLERAVRTADLFLAVSRHTEQRLLELYPALEGRTRVTPLGVDEGFTPHPGTSDDEHLQSLGVHKPYILYVGAVSRLKNVASLVRAHEGLDARLVLAGGVAGADSELEGLLQAPGVRVTGWLDPDGEPLRALYRGASAFVFPSLTEGWTSPPLEAMASGVPVVASNASSIPETVGDAALLADPEPDALREAVRRVLEDEALRRDLVQKGLDRAASFPWERTARLTLEAYREVAG